MYVGIPIALDSAADSTQIKGYKSTYMYEG